MCLLLPFHRTGAKPHGGRPNGRESRRFRPAGRRRRTGRAYKPDSVPLAGRRPSLSTPCRHGALAANPGVITGRAPSSPIRPCSGWGLPGRPVARDAGALLPHHFTLTRRSGRFVSVALSVGFRRPGVTRHPARRSPDFPLARTPAAARPARSSAILARSLLPGANAKGAGIAPAPFMEFLVETRESRTPGPERFGSEFSYRLFHRLGLTRSLRWWPPRHLASR